VCVDRNTAGTPTIYTIAADSVVVTVDASFIRTAALAIDTVTIAAYGIYSSTVGAATTYPPAAGAESSYTIALGIIINPIDSRLASRVAKSYSGCPVDR
jgi:hypothetical protein